MKEWLNTLVEAGSKLFQYLTWSRVGMIFALTILFIGVKTFLDNQPTIYTALSVARFAENAIQTPPSEATQASLKAVVDRSTTIVATEIVQVDFRNNIRDSVWFYSDEPELQAGHQKSQQSKLSESPLFIVGDSANNDRIVNIMETEFVCVEISPDVIRKIPAAGKYAKQLCTISIPPDYGKMVGWLNIWVTEPIPRNLYAEYKQLARTLSAEIYKRDVKQAVK